MTKPHLKTGVDSTPEPLCKKYFRQWILSNKFMLQIKHHCHKPFEFLSFGARHVNLLKNCLQFCTFILYMIHHHQNVLPNGRSFTANQKPRL